MHVVSRRARVLRLRRTDQPLASLRGQPCCLLPFNTGSALLIQRFSKLDSPAHRYPCLRFDGRLTASPARLGAKMESLLLSCRALSSPTTCRFIPAHIIVTAIAVGQLSARASRHRIRAVQRQEEVEKLYRLADAIAEGENVDAIVQSLSDPLRKILGLEAVAIYDKANDRIWRSGTRTNQVTEDQLRDVSACGIPLSDPRSGVSIVTIREGDEFAGSIGILGAGVSPGLLKAATDKIGAAIAKARDAERAKEAEFARKSEELKSAVFDALAHEAKGPLNLINIAATT